MDQTLLYTVDRSYAELEAQNFYITDAEAAKQQLNPFLKYRLLILARAHILKHPVVRLQ